MLAASMSSTGDSSKTHLSLSLTVHLVAHHTQWIQHRPCAKGSSPIDAPARAGQGPPHGWSQNPAVAPTILTNPQAVSFGANDACIEGGTSKQHVCLDQYMENLRAICTHEAVTAHSPRLVIITPPPVNEYKMEVTDLQKGYNGLQRTAELTKKYANAARKVGETLNIPVLDLWTIFMTRAGWVAGEPLPGSRGAARNDLIEELMYDGEWTCQQTHRSEPHS